MIEGLPGEGNQEADQPARQLKEFRDALAELHKALIDSERVEYERVFGTIPSPGAFLQLLTQDPWFAWLRPLSEFIASLDETLDEDEPVTPKTVTNLLTHARTLLKPREEGDGFDKHYYDALQRDPNVIVAHGKVVSLQR